MFRKRDKGPDYTTYEADDYYCYEDEKPNKKALFSRQSSASNREDYSYEEEVGEGKIGPSATAAIAIVIYGLFLVIGVFSTSFLVNEIGVKEPQILTVEMREERESFNQLKGQYHSLRILLIKVSDLDAQFLEKGIDNLLLMSSQYNNLLPEIDKALPFARALPIDEKYKSIKKQTEMIYEDVAIYLQKMGKAFAEDDLISFKEAMTWREKAFNDFEQLRMNMLEFAYIVKADDIEFSEDLPEIIPIELGGSD